MSQKPTEIEIHELLAFELFVKTHLERNSISREEMAKHWRQSADTRDLWRAYANEFTADLLAAGLKVDIKSSPKARTAVKSLVTIPEQPAYRLGDA